MRATSSQLKLLTLIFLALGTLGSEDCEDTPGDYLSCPTFEDPEETGDLPDVVDELSGMIVGLSNPQILWAINDGNTGKLYALDQEGHRLSTYELAGRDADKDDEDWEAMSSGPCPSQGEAQNCIYIGDIGDNDAEREQIHILRLEEPQLDSEEKTNKVLDSDLEFEDMLLVYPDGSHDAEAMLVDDLGRVYILSRDEGKGEIYSAFFQVSEEPIVLGHIGTIDLEAFEEDEQEDEIRDASWDPDLKMVLLRSTFHALQTCLSPGQSLSELPSSEWQQVPVGKDKQGEAIAIGEGGYWHSSEGDNPPLYFVAASALN